MRTSDLLATALRGVRVNITRSLLTMLGITIGVGAVVLMSAVGASMQGVILSQISSLGGKTMVIFPGKGEGGPESLGAGSDALTLEDVQQLRRLPSITDLSPVIFIPGTVKVGREEGNPQVFGTTPSFYRTISLDVTSGRLHDERDEKAAATVAVIAPDVQDKFFGLQDPIGQRIKVGDNTFTIVGVAEALGSQFFQNSDERIYVPFETAKRITAQRYVNYMPFMATDDFETAFRDVKELLRRRHKITNPDDDPKKDDFIVHSSEEANQILGGVTMGLTFFITTIAAISLLVGGIGIMNIMLVSVKERTREIGLRKAIGARSRDILLQFLLEAVLLTFIGGVIGLFGGIAAAFVITLIVRLFLASYTFALSITSLVSAVTMATLTGLIFGITPARKAALLPPMESLRYE